MSRENEEHGQTTGVRFGPLKRALREHSYPVSVAELVEQYGGFELETETGSKRVETVLERCEETRFREPRGVRDAILGALDEDVPEGEAIADESEGEGEEVAAEDDWSRLST
jgi:hypothetical protein